MKNINALFNGNLKRIASFKQRNSEEKAFIELDFNGVSSEELIQTYLLKQTTPLKHFLNNVFKGYTDLEKDKFYADHNSVDTAFKVNIKEDLIDTRKSRTLTPEQKQDKALKELINQGLTKEQILEKLQDLL